MFNLKPKSDKYRRIGSLIFVSVLFIFLQNYLHAEIIYDSEPVRKKIFIPEYNYERSPYVTEESWKFLQTYLLPSNHPIKPKLDKIFKASRVTQSTQSVKDAGFTRHIARNYSFAVVSPHPELKGYLVKMFLDNQSNTPDFEQWVERIDGANYVKASIKAHGYEKLFKVPNKWIYPLPLEPSPSPGSYRKNFILVVEDMKIYRGRKTTKRWQGNQMTMKRADAFFVILQDVGLKDSIYPFNVPFCEDGKQAFIDTEHHHKWPICFNLTTPYFNPMMQEYWLHLIGNGGPPLPAKKKK